MSTPTKSFIAVDPNSGATYRFNETDWQEKKDRFVSKYPDAEIMEYDAYNPEDTQENDNIFIATDNGAYSFSPDEWTEKGDRFMTKHPEASVSRVRTVNYWGDKAAEQEQAIKAKREAMQAIPQDATELWGNNPEYLRDLSELEEMEKAYKENPYVIAKAEAEKSSLRKLKEATENDYAAFMKEYEDVVAGGGNRVMFGGSEDAMMEGFARSLGAAVRGEDLGRQVEYDTQKPLFDAALQNISGAEDILDKPNQSENNGNAVANVFKGIGARYGSAEFWSRGMTKLVALNNGGNEAIEKINRKLQSAGDGITEEDIDKILSPAEKAYVFSLMEVANAQAQRAPMDTLPDYVNAERKVSRAYQIGEGIAEMTGFIAEFIATGSITDAATSGATKVVQGWLIKNLMAKGGKALAQKAARGLSKVAVNALTKTASAAMKSAVRTAAMGATGGLGGNIATQRTTLQEDGTFKGTGESILGGTYETAVENFTEEMGPVITDLLGAPFKPLAKPIKDYLKGIDYSDFGKLESMAKKVGYVFDKSTPMAKALAKGGYHGTVEEYGEELLGALIRGEMDEFFDKDQQLVLIGTFAPMAVLGMGGSAAHVIRSTKEVKAAAENLRLKLKESGIDDKQIDYLTDYVRSTSAEKMGKEFSPLIGRMAQESGLGQSFYTSDTYKAVARYIKAVAEYQTIDSQHKEQEGQQRADKQAELEEKYGKFYNQSDNSVNVVQLKDGRVVYQVTDFAENGEAGAVDMKDSKPITFRAEDVQTYTDKEGKTHNQESGKMSLDSYLSSEIMKRKESAQTARMREDRQRQINELTQSLPNSFDLGTKADPYSVAVKSHDANGVTVVDEKGNEMTLPWDKVGRLMNKPIKVLTDSELAEAEAAEMALKVEAVRAKNAKTSKEAQEVETDTAAIDEEVKSLQPNPEDLYTDKETGEVDEVEFWKNDPEGYCEWNDKRQQDGGIDSMKQIANARAALEGVIKKAEKEAKTDNPVTRRTAEGILFTAQQQLEKYAAIEQQYAERNSTQEEKRAEEVIAMRERASFWREKLNLGDNLVVLESLDEVKNPIARRTISLGRTEGWYDNKEGKVYLYLPDIASTRVLDKKVMHEIVTHYGLDHFLNESEYAKLTDMVWNIMSDTAKRNYYNYTGVSSIKDPTMRRRRAAEEFIAKVAEDVNFDNANAETKSIWQRILDFFKKLFEKDEINLAANEIAEALNKNIKGLVVGNEKKVEEFKAQAAAQAQTHQETAQPEVSQSEVDTQVETILNESGLSVMEEAPEVLENGTNLYSTRTYLEGGRTYLEQWLTKDKDTSEEDRAYIMDTMDFMYAKAMEMQDKYEAFASWSDAEVEVDEEGNPIMSVIKSNGDYSMNLDFSLVCKKRRALNALLNKMIKDGMFEGHNFNEKEIARINQIIQKHGFEIACALCFVDAKRYRVANVAFQFTSMYNDLVRSLVPKNSGYQIAWYNYMGNPTQAALDGVKDPSMLISNLPDDALDWTKIDKILKKAERKKSLNVEEKIAKLLKSDAKYRKNASITDFISDKGFELVTKNNPELLKLYNAKKGTGGPKASLGDVQYLNDILKSGSFAAERAYKVGGVRVQSFSDYMPHMFFDYMQMMAELAAKKLPAHAYTKEENFARIFGMTGMKINLSLVPRVVDEGIAPGLDEEGNYAWAVEYVDEEGKLIATQTFPPEVAFEMQKDPRYSGNVGAIAVGISDEHIIKMLADENIHFIIPYHKSSLNPEVAKMTKIDKYVDYTNSQTEKLDLSHPNAPKGKLTAAQKKAELAKRKFDFYGSLKETNDPKATTAAYLAHCKEVGLIPKFPQFASHENYYKLLVDFNVYDFVTGEYTPQGAVTMTFPENVSELIEAGLAEDQQLDDKLNSEIEAVAKEVYEEMGEGVLFSTSNDEEAEGKDLMFSITPQMDAEYLAAVERGDMETAQRMVNEAAKLAMPNTKVVDENGNPLIVYHGTSADFNVFDENYSSTNTGAKNTTLGFYFTPLRSYAEKIAKGDSKVIKSVFLNIQNPLELGYAKKFDGSYHNGREAKPFNYEDSKNIVDGLAVIRDAVTKKFGSYTQENVSKWKSLVESYYDGIYAMTGDTADFTRTLIPSMQYIAFFPSQIKSADAVTYDNDGNVIPLSERFNPENEDIRFSTKSATFATMDSRGKSLTPGQQTFFANSKAVDKDGNLLVLYHGTPRAGFTEFESGWFTTSKEDAISYSGDRKGRLFDPNEEYIPETLTAGDFPLGYMTFDSEEDRAAFLAEHPTAESALSESEYENARMQAEDEEYDALTERKPKLQEIWDAYREYERDHFVDTTIGDILNNPDAYTEDDLRRAVLAYDSNAVFDSIDELETTEERKSALVDSLNYMNEDAKENGADGILDIMVATRVPRNGEGIKHNDIGNRTYEVYANIERPYEIDADGRHSEFESGDIYKAVDSALKDDNYDGIIIRNWRVGRHQQVGDVVVPKNGSQVKLTSNENPTESEDVRFSTRQSYESAKVFIQTETDKFYETYNTTLPAKVVYANSRKMIAEALGYKVEEMPDALYKAIREEAKKGYACVVSIDDKPTAILVFPREDVNQTAKVSRILFHENTHPMISDKPELLDLGKWLIENPVGIAEGVAEQVKSQYAEEDWNEEMVCDYIGAMLSLGRSQEALDSVPEEYKPLLNYVYERFGYKPEDEDPRRRSERLGDARELHMRNSENEENNEGNSGYLFSTAGREKSVDEIVEEGKQKVSAEHTQTVDAFMDRIRRINGNLQQLRMAAAAQREYDQKTVKTITDIANNLLEGGALNDLTRGEIKRLLSIINGGVGKSDLTKSVDRLMDLMVANQLRYGKNLIEKFLKIRGSKVDQRGVEVRGTLDIPGQQMLAAFKEGIGLSKEKLADRIADAEDALSSDSETKKRNAENELVGLYLAKQYHEDINDSIEEEKDLRNEIKVADEDYKAGKITKEMHKQLLDTIYEAILENRIQRVNAYEKLASDLGAKMVSSIKNAGLLRDAEKERVQKIQHFANSDMQGMPADMHGVKENRFWNSPLVRFFLKPLATFDQMLRSFAPKSTSGEGYLWNHFMGGWTKATESEYKGVQEAHEMLDSAARTMFGEGVERWSDLFAKERKMPKITIKVWDNGEMVDKEISQGNALYIYMVNKMTDGKMKLRKMGISQEDVDAIVAQMDPRFITLADWMQERFLPSLRDKYNAVHERLFGAPMASIDNYFPIKVNPGARTREVDVEAGEGTAKPATITGSIIKRTKNSLALDIMNADAFDVMLEHIQQMEHWAAFAEFNKDLNTLLSYRKFRNRVENMSGIYGSGKTVWSNFKTVAEIAAGVYQPASKSDSLDKTALNVAKGVTGAKISFRVYTAIKQLLSMPAFVSDANIVTLAKNIATPWIAWNWAMENLPMFEKRWKSRQAGDTRLMQTDSDWKIWKYKIVELAGRYGMTPNAFIDAVTVSIGARSIYETKYQSYLDMGYSEEQADKKAKQDATILFNESQQSNESAFLSAVQVDRTVASVAFTVFRNSAMGYQRMAVDAWRNISHMMRKGYKEESIEYMKKQMVRDGLTEEQAERAATRVYNRSFAKNAARLVTFQFLVQFAWNLGAYLPYLLVGDDDDEKKAMVKDAAIRGLVGGPIEGMAGGSIVSNMAGNLAMGEKLSDVNTTLLPVISDIEKTIKMLDYDKVAAYNEMFNILIQSGIGVNPQTFTDFIVAIEDACNGEPQTSKEVALCIMRALQVPQSQLEKVYFDEIDFTVDKGLDLTIEEFAKRYANYKVNRGTPLTGWMYEDEVEKEREDKYIKRFLETAEELKRSRGNEEAKKYYEYLDTDYKETTETINELKRKAKEAAMKGDQVGAMEYAKMLTDFMETDLFKDYVKFGGKANAIERIRDKMKKVDLQTRESLEDRMLELRKDMVEEMEKANL